MSKLKVLSILSTVVLLVGYFIVTEEQLFSSALGILMVLVYMVSLITSYLSILKYDSVKIAKGQKHREKLMGIVVLIDSLMFLVLTLYFADYYFTVAIFNVYLIIGTLLFIVGYFVMAYLFDYVILEEGGLSANYFLSLRTTHIKYDDIVSMSFGVLMNNIRIKTKDKTHFIDISLVNGDAVLNELFKLTSDNIHQETFAKVGQYFSFFGVKSNLEYLDYFKEKTLIKNKNDIS